MHPYTHLLQTAAGLFGVAALGGLLMAIIRLRGAPHPPAWLAFGHGLLAAAGLTLMIYAACTVGLPPLAQFALGALLVAALGGSVLNLMYHQKQLPLPVGIMVVHALLAVTGFVMLFLAAFGSPVV